MAQFDPHGRLLSVGRKRQLSLLELDGRRQVRRANQRIVIAQPRLKFRWVRHKKKTARFRTTLFEPLLASQRADLFPARRKVGTKGMISIGYFLALSQRPQNKHSPTLLA